MKKGYKELLAEANAAVETIPAAEAIKLLDDPNVVFIDLRDSVELQQNGRIPESVHTPRGSLEFQVDPESPSHKTIYASDKKFVFY